MSYADKFASAKDGEEVACVGATTRDGVDSMECHNIPRNAKIYVKLHEITRDYIEKIIESYTGEKNRSPTNIKKLPIDIRKKVLRLGEKSAYYDLQVVKEFIENPEKINCRRKFRKEKKS